MHKLRRYSIKHCFCMGRDFIVAGNRSFKDYVADRFENELFDAIQNYIGDNYKNLDLKLYRVRTIGCIELSDIEVKFVSVVNRELN